MSKWPIKPLHEVAEVIRGVSFDKSQVRDNPTTEFVPILRAGNIQNSLITDTDLVYVHSNLVKQEQRIKAGDLAICMSSGSPAIVGKSAYANNDLDGSVGAFCAIIRFKNTLNHRFGAYWFKSPEYLQWRDTKAKGANIQNLRRSELESILLPVPPLPEQARIVKLLDEADALQKLRNQADKRSAELIPALFNEMFGDPCVNPKGWQTFPVSSFVADLQGGRSVNPAGAEEKKGLFRVLKISAVTGGTFLSGESKPVTAGYDPPKNHIVRPGDLLFSRANTTELVGATTFVFETPPNLLLPDKLWRFVWKQPMTVHPLYIWFFFQSSSIRRELGKRATGTGGSMKNISKPKVMSLEVPLPPYHLQNEFSSLVAEIRAMESDQSSSRQSLDALFQSMLHRTFQGEL